MATGRKHLKQTILHSWANRAGASWTLQSLSNVTGEEGRQGPWDEGWAGKSKDEDASNRLPLPLWEQCTWAGQRHLLYFHNSSQHPQMLLNSLSTWQTGSYLSWNRCTKWNFTYSNHQPFKYKPVWKFSDHNSKNRPDIYKTVPHTVIPFMRERASCLTTKRTTPPRGRDPLVHLCLSTDVPPWAEVKGGGS